jgi:hypothetical protein
MGFKNKKMKKLLFLSITIAVFFAACTSKNNNHSEKEPLPVIVFEDTFDKDSEGEYIANVIGLPEPEGLGFDWEVLPGGQKPVSWILSDECEPSDPKKGLWVIPADSGYMHQGGRSKNSVLFANKPVPLDTEKYSIEFKQNRGDNDKIMFLLVAPEPTWEWTTEIGCEIQMPGTDSTTNDAYVLGALGNFKVEGAAFHHKWASHKIEVNGENVKWTCNDILMAEGNIECLKPGYFGIRQRYERNTLYDDVKITILK